jgi:hypothetical protein
MFELRAIGLYKQNRHGVCTVAEKSRRRPLVPELTSSYLAAGIFRVMSQRDYATPEFSPRECGFMKQPELPALRGDDFHFELSDM